MGGEGHQREPDGERVVPRLGEQVCACRGIAGSCSATAADRHNLPTPAAVAETGDLAHNMHIERAAERCLSVQRAGKRGRWMDAERVRVPFQGFRLPSGKREHRDHLQTAQLECPGEQVSSNTRNRPGLAGLTSAYEPVRASSTRTTLPG